MVVVRTVVALLVVVLVGTRLIGVLRARRPAAPDDPSGPEAAAPIPVPAPAAGREQDGDRVRNEPTSGLWIFGIVTLALLYLTLLFEPAHATPCLRRLAELPAVDVDALLVCAKAPVSGLATALHLALILTYTWFFRECVRWGYRCLSRRWARTFLATCGNRFVYLAAVVDLAVLLQGRLGVEHVSPLHLAWVKLLVFAPNLAIAVVVLGTGLRRFALPWTVPPEYRAEVRRGGGTAADPPEAGNGAAWTEPQPIPKPTGPADSAARWFTAPENGLHQPVPYAIGLSGGGVRSAAFCSGVLQSLAASPRWSLSRAAYLATVSGGGYVGVSTQMIRHELGNDGSPCDPYAADAPETTGFAERHRYLGDDALERAQVLLALVTGFIINALLIAGPIAVLGAALAVVPDLPAGVRPVALCAAGVVLVIGWLLLLFSGAEGSVDRVVAWFSSWWSNESTLESWAKRARWFAGVCAIVGSVLLALTLPFEWTWLRWTGGFAGAGVVVCLLAAWTSCSPLQNLSRVLFLSFWVSIGLIGLGALASGKLGNPTEWEVLVSDTGWLTGWALATALLVAAFVLLDQTSWSPHPFYKARIARTFAVRRVLRGSRWTSQQLSYDEYSYLDEWAAPAPGGPKLLICATANAEDISLPPQGTRAVPFVFADDYVGSPELGWWTTADFRRCLGRHLAVDGTLQAATAISGAAVASGLGVHGRIPSVGTALALLNARLGVWLPNPHAKRSARRWPDDNQPGVWNRLRAGWVRRRRPLWLWREVAGFLPSIKRYIYVSDGGHLDNLGLLELLRRRSRVILIVDASADRARTTNTLDGVLALAAQHLQVTITRDRAKPLTTKATFHPDRPSRKLGAVTADCVETMTINYPQLSASDPAQQGVLVVAKARMAATLFEYEEGRAVAEAIEASHAPRRWPWSLQSLPTTLTANQWLTDAQFHNYVRLGRAVGRHAAVRLDAVPTSFGAAGELVQSR